MEKETRYGISALVISTTIYASTGLFIRLMTGLGLNVYTINFIELIIGLPLIFFITKAIGKKIKFPDISEIPWLVTIGLCHFGITITLFFAYNDTTIANVEFLHYTFPIFTMLGGMLFFAEGMDRWKIGSLFLSAAGLILIFFQELTISHNFKMGDLLALFSALPVAVMTLAGRRLKDRDPYFTTFWSTWIAATIYLPFYLSHNSISGFEEFPFHLVLDDNTLMGFKQIGAISIASLLFMATAAPLYYFGLKHIEASKAGILMLMEILFATIMAAITYQETPTLVESIGGFLIFLSGVAVLKSKPKKIPLRRVSYRKQKNRPFIISSQLYTPSQPRWSYRRNFKMHQVNRTSHALYHIKYHFIWMPRRLPGKHIDGIIKNTRETLVQIAVQYGLEMIQMEVEEKYVYVALTAPPKYAPGEIVRWMKDITTREIFNTFPEIKDTLWTGEIWKDDYFVSSMDNFSIADVINEYTRYLSCQNLLNPLGQIEDT